MPRPILVTGATGKQGGSVVDAILEQPDDMVVLAVTRNPESASAQKLAARGVKLVKGDLNDVPSLFEAAKAVAPGGQVWGVFSVQMASMRTDGVNLEANAEVKQGVALIDEAIKAGVTHFVYSSVDRGGESKSWQDMTPVPHFRTKALIENHLKNAAEGTNMSWSILRPAIFYDNITNDFSGKVILTSVRDVLGTKKMPWIATEDIGRFAAIQLRDYTRWKGRALSLGGEPIDFADINATFRKVTGADAPTTFSFMASAFNWAIPEFGTMFKWFKEEGYRTDVAELKKLNPAMLNFEQWLATKSEFKPKE